MSNFDKVAASPETLGKFLSSIPIATEPWDELFHRQFCDACERECDVEHCPHQDVSADDKMKENAEEKMSESGGKEGKKIDSQ